jgi:putative hydrolase of HD superfamily
MVAGQEAEANVEGVTARLLAQMDFLREVDKLKGILRRTSLIDGSRRENSAEHSWHIALAAMVLAEYSNAPVDLLRVVKILLVHDIVEIDAGDTFAFDVTAKASQPEREHVAATRLFGLLPDDQRAEMMALWEEFEGRATAEAKFANALDRLLPVLQNFANQGGTWKAHRLHRGQVNQRLSPIGDGSAQVWDFVEKVLDQSEALAYIGPLP